MMTENRNPTANFVTPACGGVGEVDPIITTVSRLVNTTQPQHVVY